MLSDEKQKLLDEVMKELDEMLEAHERYKEEYAMKRANLTNEELLSLELEELRASRAFAEEHNMATVTLQLPED